MVKSIVHDATQRNWMRNQQAELVPSSPGEIIQSRRFILIGAEVFSKSLSC